MNSFKLAAFNVKNNLRLFKFNIASMIFSIAVFFNFFSLVFNPSLSLAGSDELLIKATLLMTAILLVFFIFFFIMYSNSFFLKQRKREIGIYTFMGVSNASVAKVFAIEEMILGILSLAGGILSGMVFQKAFLMLLTRVAGLKTEINFYFSITAIIITSSVFALIFIFAAFKGFISILRSRLIDLLNAEKQEDRVLKTRYITGIASVILITIGFVFSRDIFNDAFFINSCIVIFCFIAGTFLLFSSFLSLVIKLLQSDKRILYKGVNIISISNVAYRIRYNYKTLACIAIIVAATITSIGTAFVVQHMFQTSVKISHPYSFSYVGGNENTKKKALDIINDSGHRTENIISINYLIFDSRTNPSKKYPVIKRSDFICIEKDLKVEGWQKVISYTNSLPDGAAFSTASTNDNGFMDGQVLNMYGMNVRIEKTMTVPLLGSKFENNTIVLTDEDYNKFKENCTRLAVPQREQAFIGICITDQENSQDITEQLSQIPALKNNLSSYSSYYNNFNAVTGVIKFTGIFLGVVFMLSTASIMYMKLMSDAISDKEKYQILIKLGLDKKELHKSVSKQVGLSYMLPLIVGAVYAFMAIGALEKFLNIYLEISLVKPFLYGLAIYTLVYICFYFYTIRKFISLVKP